MKFAIFPYKAESESAKLLAEKLSCKRIKHEGSHFNKWNKAGWFIINYGSTVCPTASNILNSSLAVSVAINKLSFFERVKGHCRIPDFTSSKDTAKEWVQNGKVVCRTTLSGHSGQGIHLAKTVEEIVNAPLYTKYVAKDSEWRLHFAFDNETPFFIQQKKRKSDFEGEVNSQIRNLDNGWIYAHHDLNIPDNVLQQGRRAFGSIGLDFGAIDIIYRKSTNKAYVLECNTAPGLQGTTLDKYAEQFLKVT